MVLIYINQIVIDLNSLQKSCLAGNTSKARLFVKVSLSSLKNEYRLKCGLRLVTAPLLARQIPPLIRA